MDAIKSYESLLSSLLTKGNWNEEDHPRHPAGSENGGQFAPAGGGGGDGDGGPVGRRVPVDPGKRQQLADDMEDRLMAVVSSMPRSTPDEVVESLSEYAGIAASGLASGNRSEWRLGVSGMIESIQESHASGDIKTPRMQSSVRRLERLMNSVDFVDIPGQTGKSDERRVGAAMSVLPAREFKFVSASTEHGQMVFEGYGAVFGNVDSHGDIIEPGAFKSFLDRVHSGEAEWPVMLLQHGGMMMGSAQDMTPIGVWEDIREDQNGLYVKGVLANTERGREVYELIRMKPRPAISGLSIGYSVEDSSPAPMGTKAKRLLKSVNLAEISMVTFPSNGRARVNHSKMTARELERKLMQDAGLSRSQARSLMRLGASQLVATQDAGTQAQ